MVIGLCCFIIFLMLVYTPLVVRGAKAIERERCEKLAEADRNKINLAIYGLEMLEPDCRCNMKGFAKEHGHTSGCLVVVVLEKLKGAPGA